jgi:hypothetical protein
MENNGTKVLPKQYPSLPFNRVIPDYADVHFEHSEVGRESKLTDVS